MTKKNNEKDFSLVTGILNNWEPPDVLAKRMFFFLFVVNKNSP